MVATPDFDSSEVEYCGEWMQTFVWWPGRSMVSEKIVFGRAMVRLLRLSVSGGAEPMSYKWCQFMTTEELLVAKLRGDI